MKISIGLADGKKAFVGRDLKWFYTPLKAWKL
jgi:hypothetical protein